MRTIPRRPAAAALFALGLLPLPAAAEDFTVVSELTTARGRPRTQTQYVTAGRIRTADDRRDTVVDLGSGRVTIVDHRRKEYSESSLEDVRAFTRQLDRAMTGRRALDEVMGPSSAVSVQRGGSRKVAGFDAQQYIVTVGEAVRYEAWLAPALKPPAGYYDARRIHFAAMGPMATRFDRIFDEMEKLEGFPLATVVEYRLRMGPRRATTEAVEVRRGAVPDAAFAAPTEYTKTPSPFAAR